VVDRTIEDGFVRRVTVALEFHGAAGAALPALADLRLKVEGPAALARVGMADAVLQAGKRVLPAPQTGRAFQVLPDGTHQILLAGGSPSTRIGSGRWLLLDVDLGTADGPAHTPMVMSLVAREGILAPTAADQTLWNTPLGQPVVVWANEVTP